MRAKKTKREKKGDGGRGRERGRERGADAKDREKIGGYGVMGKVQRPQLPCVYLMTPGIGRPDRGPRHVCNVPTVCQCSRRPDVTMLDVMRPGSRGHSRHSRPGGRSVSRPLASDQSAEKRQGQILHDKDSLSLSLTLTLPTSQLMPGTAMAH